MTHDYAHAHGLLDGDSETTNRQGAGESGASRRVASELRRSLVAIFRGEHPDTVVGYLVTHDEPATVFDIAGDTGLSVEAVESAVRDLEDEDLVLMIRESGLEKVVRFAASSLKNGRY